MLLQELLQRIGRRMRVAAGCVELERGLGQCPARPEAIGQARRVRVARHAGRQALGAVEDAAGAREAVPGEIGGRQARAGRVRSV